MIKPSNPRVRNALYLVYSALSLALGSVVVFCGASSAYALPDWATPAGAVLAYIGSGLGLVASSNTPAGAASSGTPEPGAAAAVEPASAASSGTPEPGTVPAVEPAGAASAVEPEPGTVPAVEPAGAASAA